MISYAVKGLDRNPIMSSTMLIGVIFALSVAPNFTRDAYLKLLPNFLIPAIMIASSDATGFAMNVELIMGTGILVAGYIKILDMFERTKRLMKDPQIDKFQSSLVYISIFGVFMSVYVGVGMGLGIPLHAPVPQPKTSAYLALVLIYTVIALASATGFQIGFGSFSTKKKSSGSSKGGSVSSSTDESGPFTLDKELRERVVARMKNRIRQGEKNVEKIRQVGVETITANLVNEGIEYDKDEVIEYMREGFADTVIETFITQIRNQQKEEKEKEED